MRKYGLRSYRLKAIEDALLDLFHGSRAELPTLEEITFSVTRYNCTKKVEVHGFIHTSSNCHLCRSVEALDSYLDKTIKIRKKKEILFQSFKGVLS